ncbi:hypothetical protein [Streptomyces sp. NBC_00503]|uniref:hypothetical protein n=1 Tax=Streptomyces sp. NBC_00503 TaxID=2903659 RepID=UPI002E812644|nr:hypothetical protein [Streptomyces sp. NBC_00503]WUD80322.1 hypothetical protein OG490_07000 [Streptomyces sp. NBC_00503]
MDGIVTGQVLASKWDAVYGVGVFLRVLFGTLPAWAKWIISGLLGATALWEGCRWWYRRREAVR